jgi:hypothetical protein
MITEQYKFRARACTFDNKRCTPEKRQAIACKAIRLFLWHIIPEISRKAVEGVELLTKGAGDKKQVQKALREAQIAFDAYFETSESRKQLPEFAGNAFSCARCATFMPMTWSNFYDVFDHTAKVLIAEAQEQGPLSLQKPEVHRFGEMVFVRFNDFIEPFVNFPKEFKDNAPSKVRQNLKYFSPLFKHTEICADAEREWVYFNLHEETQRQTMFNALDAWDAVAVVPTVTLMQLDPILLAAKHTNLVLRRTGLSLLILLSQVHEAARQALLSLLDSKKAITRWQCLTHVDYYRVKDLPNEFIEQMIRKGLEDKLLRTRQAAACLVMRYQRKDLVSLLEQKLAEEGDAETVKSYQFVIPLVRDGYFLEQEPNGDLRLTSWTPYSIGSQPILREDATPGKIKQIIAEEWASEEKFMGDFFRAGD